MAPPRVQLAVGRRYGLLMVIGQESSGPNMVTARCRCGETIITKAHRLASAHTRSCGCVKGKNRLIPIKQGAKFGRLSFIRRVDGRIALWRCRCGKTTKAAIANVRGGHTKSCGCFHDESALGNNYRLRHGHAREFKVTREYRTWGSMKARCLRPSHKSYPNYGGRGISICKRWLRSFTAFLADMGPRPKGHSLDRINPDGNYVPKNCRWADAKTQRTNRRKRKSNGKS